MDDIEREAQAYKEFKRKCSEAGKKAAANMSARQRRKRAIKAAKARWRNAR